MPNNNGILETIADVLLPKANDSSGEKEKGFLGRLLKILKKWIGIGEETKAELEQVKEATEASLLANVVHHAAKYVGCKEGPINNTGEQIEGFTGGEPIPWYAAFVSRVLLDAGAPVKCQKGWREVSTIALRAYFESQRSKKRWINMDEISDLSQVKPGYVIIWRYPAGAETQGHTEIVERIEDDTVHTIGGNIRGPGSSRSDCVARTKHTLAELRHDSSKGKIGFAIPFVAS